MQRINMLVVGDSGVGKSTLIIRYMEGTFNKSDGQESISSGFYVATIKKHDIRLIIQDTAGQKSFACLRPLFYRDASVIIVCFSVTDRASFESVNSTFINEVRRHGKRQASIVIVGTMIDLRKEDVETHVTKEEGLALAESEGAFGYFECSAKLAVGCDTIFEKAAISAAKEAREAEVKSVVKDTPSGDKSRCTLL